MNGNKENPWLVLLGLIVMSAVMFMMLWSAFETDPQYRQPPSYVTQDDFRFSEAGREGWIPMTNAESEASNVSGR